MSRICKNDLERTYARCDLYQPWVVRANHSLTLVNVKLQLLQTAETQFGDSLDRLKPAQITFGANRSVKQRSFLVGRKQKTYILASLSPKVNISIAMFIYFLFDHIIQIDAHKASFWVMLFGVYWIAQAESQNFYYGKQSDIGMFHFRNWTNSFVIHYTCPCVRWFNIHQVDFMPINGIQLMGLLSYVTMSPLHIPIIKHLELSCYYHSPRSFVYFADFHSSDTIKLKRLFIHWFADNNLLHLAFKRLNFDILYIPCETMKKHWLLSVDICNAHDWWVCLECQPTWGEFYCQKNSVFEFQWF